MNSVRTALELARGDFLERARRSGFLLTLGMAAGLAASRLRVVVARLPRTGPRHGIPALLRSEPPAPPASGPTRRRIVIGMLDRSYDRTGDV